MRILLLSHYFPPEVNAPANRGYEHAREWVRLGHEVTVVTGVPNHPHGRLFPGYRNRFLSRETVDGIRVLRTWMYLAPNRGFLRRILNYVSFAVMAVVAGLRVRRPDVVVATSPQFFVGLAGRALARLKGCAFVFEVRDLWPASIVQLGQLRARPLVRALELVESALYRSADAVVVNSPRFVEHVARAGAPRERIHVVENGVDPARFAPGRRRDDLLVRYGLERRFVVGYVGTLGLAHGLDTVLDTARSLRESDRDVAFVLLGDGADRERLERVVREEGLDNVRVPGLRPHAEIPAWIASLDAALVLLRDLPVFESVIPSKMFEYMAQQRPVIAGVRGVAREIVESNEAGFAIPPGSPAALAAAIRRVRAEPAEAARRARAARELVTRRYARPVLAGRMLHVLTRVARAPGR